VTLFYSGDNTAETPGNWAGKTVDEIAAVPGPMYDYVKQEMLLFKANGAWPDLVSIGNEVNTGMFNTTGANGLSPSGTNCTPTADGGGTGTANCFPRIQRAAMQAIADAATDTSVGPALPAPLTCIHVDGNPDLQRFFSGATQTNGIPLDVACESYYPGWHGPLTKAQQTWHPCNTANCGSTVQHVAEVDVLAAAYRGRTAGVEEVSAADLAERIADGRVVVLDVRPRAEFDAGHIAGARSAPVTELPAQLDDVPAGSEVVAYCRGPFCVYADDAVRLLRARGVSARRLDVGFPEWRRAGYPTTVPA